MKDSAVMIASRGYTRAQKKLNEATRRNNRAWGKLVAAVEKHGEHVRQQHQEHHGNEPSHE